MTEKLRVAAKQALEALKHHGAANLRFGMEAIVALEAALAEPEPCQYPECVDNGPDGKCTRWLLAECEKSEDFCRPARPDVPESSFGNLKPVGWFEPPHGAFRANPQYRIRFPSQLLSWQIPLYTHPPKAEPEPVQEPVAWMYTGIKSDSTEHGPHLVWKPAYMDAMSASKGAQATPLYLAPPQSRKQEALASMYIALCDAIGYSARSDELQSPDEWATQLYAHYVSTTPPAEPVHQFRKQYCANWYDGHPDHTDGGGPYEERTLYLAPPQRPPLTDEEINDLFSEAVKGDKSVHWLCRAVERAVRGEKE